MGVGFGGQDPRTPFGPTFLTQQNERGNNFGNMYGTGSGYDAIQQHYGSMAQLNPQWDQWIKMAKAAGGGDISFGGPARSGASLDPNASTGGQTAGQQLDAMQGGGQQQQPDFMKGLSNFAQGSGTMDQVGRGSSDWYSLSPDQRTKILGAVR